MYNAGFADVVDKVDVADSVFPRGGEAPEGVPLTLLLCARHYKYNPWNLLLLPSTSSSLRRGEAHGSRVPYSW